jgi:hypothetical protein
LPSVVYRSMPSKAFVAAEDAQTAFFASLAIHTPSPRSHAAAASSAAYTVLVIAPAPPHVQTKARLLAKLGRVASTEVIMPHQNRNESPPQQAGPILAVMAATIEAPAPGLMWLHGGEGDVLETSLNPSTGGAESTDRAATGGILVSDSGTLDLPVTSDTASIGNRHGFSGLSGNAGNSIGSSSTGVPVASGPTSPGPIRRTSASQSNLAASALSLGSAGGNSASAGGSGSGSAAVMRRDVFDDLFAFDTRSHTWRRIDTAGNALQVGTARAQVSYSLVLN